MIATIFCVSPLFFASGVLNHVIKQGKSTLVAPSTGLEMDADDGSIYSS
jgi:hypothetical protein